MLETFNIKVIEEILGGRIERWFARYIAEAHYSNPVALLQGSNGVGAHCNTTHLFNITPGQGLAIGNQGHGLEHGTRVALGFLSP